VLLRTIPTAVGCLNRMMPVAVQWSTMGMDGSTQQRCLSNHASKHALALPGLALAGLVVAQGAVAAPPLHARQVPQVPQHQSSVQAQHLDLRPPSHIAEIGDSASDRSSFPSRHQTSGPQTSVQLPALGTDGVRARPTVQEFVRRVHQEGLPVARLFEGKSAMVHLGLSPKGKPGLWLVQKTH
jgi:hypothetical protein